MLTALGGWLWGLFSYQRNTPDFRAIYFIFLFAILMQFASYLWVNLYRDAQAQGKYLLPALPVVILIMSLAIHQLGTQIRAMVAETGLDNGLLRISLICLFMAAPVYVHLQGLVHYAIPFYKLDFYYAIQQEDFEPWSVDWHAAVKSNEIEVARLRGRSVLVTSRGTDPWIVFDREYARPFANGVMLRVTLEAEANGAFSMYWDEGRGLSESLSAHRHYNVGYQTIYLKLETLSPQRIRVDPAIQPGSLIIYDIAVAPLARKHLTVRGYMKLLLDDFTAHFIQPTRPASHPG